MPNERRYSNELNLESVGINLPYNMQAEQSVLGAVLLKPDTLTDLVEILKPEMFYTRQNAQIWTEMLRLFTNDQTIDFVTLLDAVVSDGVFPSADEAKIYLTGLAETVPSISNVKAYAQIVQEKYLVRQLMGVAKDILQDAGDEPDADLLLENAEQRIYEIRSGRDSSALTPLSSSMVETLTNLQKISGPDADKYKGIPTGFRLLDTVLTGLGRGDLLLQFLQLFLLLLLFLFQCGHLCRLALLLLQLSLGLGRISRSDGHGGDRTQQHQQCQHGAQNTFRFLHATAPFFTPGGTGVWRSGCRPHPPEYPCPGTPGPQTAIFS